MERYIHLKAYNADAYLIMGYSWYKLKDYKKALENFKKSLSLRVDNPKCLYNITKVFLKLNRIEEAKDTLEKLLHFKPIHPQVMRLKNSVDSAS
jgi:tetratricopeptide (TPR) repeat protein